MTQVYHNRFGRRAGRGVRPWLLLPKIVAVAVYVGGLAAVLGLWIASDFASLEPSDPRRELVLRQVSRLMVFLVVPALLLAIILGIALLLQMPRQFLRMRWLQVKLIGLAVLIPSAHLFCRWQFTTMAAATDRPTSEAAASRFLWGIVLSLTGSIAILVIGRLKPRLGQNLARAHAAAAAAGAPLPRDRIG